MLFSKYIRTLLSQGPELNDEQREQEAQWGPPRGDPTQWASCLRVVDPSTLESASVLELDNNEAALSMCCVRFTGAAGYLLAVGTVQNLGFYPRAADGKAHRAPFLSAYPPLQQHHGCIQHMRLLYAGAVCLWTYSHKLTSRLRCDTTNLRA